MSQDAHSLRTHTSGDDGCRIVQLNGDVDFTTSPNLRDLLLELSERQPHRLIIDLSGVGYMDSSGVGTMVELKRNVERGGGRLLLAGLGPRVRSVLEIAQLDRFFTITASVAEACRA